MIPIVQNVQGNPNGGGDPVKANLTIDLHLAYQFQTESFGHDRISLAVINVADTDPPFYLGATGYDTWVASPLGRVVKLGLTATF